MSNDLDWVSLYLIESHKDLKQRYEESEKNFYKLIKYEFKRGVCPKVLAYYIGLSLRRIEQIIHTKTK